MKLLCISLRQSRNLGLTKTIKSLLVLNFETWPIELGGICVYSLKLV